MDSDMDLYMPKINNPEIDFDSEWEEIQKWEDVRAKRDNKILRKLKKSTAPKFYQAITDEFEHHMFCGDFEIVSQKDCTGEKIKGDFYNGESTPVKHVYSDVSGSGYFDDSYSGYIYIKIDKGRYFKMNVNS